MEDMENTITIKMKDFLNMVEDSVKINVLIEYVKAGRGFDLEDLVRVMFNIREGE